MVAEGGVAPPEARLMRPAEYSFSLRLIGVPILFRVGAMLGTTQRWDLRQVPIHQ